MRWALLPFYEFRVYLSFHILHVLTHGFMEILHFSTHDLAEFLHFSTHDYAAKLHFSTHKKDGIADLSELYKII